MDKAREAAWRQWVDETTFPNNVVQELVPVAFDAGWSAALEWAQDEQDPRDEPFTPGQYRQARGVAPPQADAPSVTETIRKSRGDG